MTITKPRRLALGIATACTIRFAGAFTRSAISI